MTRIKRRSFLKLLGLSTTGMLGCSKAPGFRLPYIDPPDSEIPGEGSWFCTTCRECPAGCGMLAKNRDNRLIKVEGNPEHPVNRGKLCPRGQASLTRLYDPDRIRQPMRKTGGGFAPMSWAEGEQVLAEELAKAGGPGRGKLVFMTELITGPLRELSARWASSAGGFHVVFEPLIYEPLKEANRLVFGRERIPTYRIDQADFLISFNAGFLETWLSNVEYARRFQAFREPRRRGEPGRLFVFVGPRQSMTAVNADVRIQTAPGDEYLVAVGLLLVLLEEQGYGPSHPGLSRERIQGILKGHTLQTIVARTGIPEPDLRAVAKGFREARRPLALAEGLTWFSSGGVESALAANLLNCFNPATAELIGWDEDSAQEEVTAAGGLKKVFENMRAGGVDLFVFHNANPVFSLPSSWDADGAIQKAKRVISFSSYLDETAALADFILPAHTPLESWGEHSPRRGITGILQPAMGNLFDTRHLGDILIMSGKKWAGEKRFPWKNFQELLFLSWGQRWKKSGSGADWESFWAGVLTKGGSFTENGSTAGAPPPAQQPDFVLPPPAGEKGKQEAFDPAVYPSVQFYDGRMADSPWIQELPDPITQTTWGGWAEIHPETAERLGVKRGDLLEIASEHGKIRVPALPMYSVGPATLGIPLGQGHTEYGRFARGLPDNPMALFPPEPDGQQARPPLRVKIRKTGETFPVAHTDGSLFDQGRGIIQTVTQSKYRADLAAGKPPEITMPLPSGWEPQRDFYKPHAHTVYRWSMVVDLDRCIGCGACVMACYAENNVAFVGRERILQEREMSWIRVQRYFNPEDRHAHWLVMLCQHCDSAPCESVCPIYAPQHSSEGLNNQVYNRCFGTRFCSQDDPYKVRRFNFFWYTRPWPLSLQLNPDVTVRQMGVMEKCSFCVQRIIDAKISAREKGRKVKDGDFTTACAQTCPTDALIFGNLLDPESRVAKLIGDARAYQVLHDLNTKPAVIYLKRIEQTAV